MHESYLPRSFVTAVMLGSALAAQGCSPPGDAQSIGTGDQRAALADTILARTARREAFSVPKQTSLNFSPLAVMAMWRDTVVAAASEEELFYALLRMSNARRDRHLAVALVPDGIKPSFTDGLDGEGGVTTLAPREAPMRILADFAESDCRHCGTSLSG
jgi:hypothetical protein